MAIPSISQFYLPMLQALEDKQPHSAREIADAVAQRIGITEEEKRNKVKRYGEPTYYKRAEWVLRKLKRARLIENTERGYCRLTNDGVSCLLNPPKFDKRFFNDRQSMGSSPELQQELPNFSAPAPELSQDVSDTPNDRIEEAYSELNDNLAEELLSEIMAKDSDFFEELVVKLLLKMGYGGSASDSGFRTQRTNDGGIDGIIRQDKLGFDQIYIQAKQWNPETSVGRPEIQQFYGALSGVNAHKGLFITTAKFSQGAIDYAKRQRIVLVDGERLTRLMIEYNVGVSAVAKYEIKAIDSDFFNDEKA